MRKTLTLTALLATLLLTACSEDVDPEYLKVYENYAAKVCGCVKDFKPPMTTAEGGSIDLTTLKDSLNTVEACVAPHEKAMDEIKSPTDDPPGVYEESLSEGARSKLRRLRKKGSDCLMSLNKYRGMLPAE